MIEAAQQYLWVIVFVALLITEQYASWCPTRYQAGSRWRTNFVLYLINQLLIWLPPVVVASELASEWAATWRIVDQDAWPVTLQLLFAVLALDFVAYWMHRLSHRWSLLWRLHRVHHSDRDVDTTTTLRHHPLETLFSVVWFTLTVALLDISVAGLAAYLVLERCITPLSHANLRMPKVVDKWVGRLLVLPSFHRVHHSAFQAETDSNYSLVFPWWDKLFGSYTRQPSRPYEDMTLGLSQYNSEQEQAFLRTLANPFGR